MIELKTFYEQAQKLRIAQRRKEQLAGKTHGADRYSYNQSVDIVNELENQFDKSLEELDKQLRIAPEQVSADQNLTSALEASLNGWKQELELIRREQVDQALIDAKAGSKSNRYVMLEKREKDLLEAIADAEKKLGRVSERVAYVGFGNIKPAVDNILNNAKP